MLVKWREREKEKKLFFTIRATLLYNNAKIKKLRRVLTLLR